MAFIVNTDGTIQTDSLNDAIALSARLSGRTLALDEPIPFRPMPIQQDAYPGRIVPERTPVAKPRPAKLAPPKVEPGARRQRGTGSVGPLGKNWRWTIGTSPNRTGKGGYPTREAAEAALDAHLAGDEPALVAPPTVPSTPTVPTTKAGEWIDDNNGLQMHRVCNGSGKVEDPDKKRGKTKCHGCDGEGFRRAG